MPTPVLIIDDADRWGTTTSSKEADARAHALFAYALQTLWDQPGLHLIVAVQDHWTEAGAYSNLRRRLDETITIPSFWPDAYPALRRIIASHGNLELGDGEYGVDGLLDDGAMARLEAEYDHHGRDLRHMLRVLQRAVLDAESDVERFTHAHIRRAARSVIDDSQ